MQTLADQHTNNTSTLGYADMAHMIAMHDICAIVVEQVELSVLQLQAASAKINSAGCFLLCNIVGLQLQGQGM